MQWNISDLNVVPHLEAISTQVHTLASDGHTVALACRERAPLALRLQPNAKAEVHPLQLEIRHRIFFCAQMKIALSQRSSPSGCN